MKAASAGNGGIIRTKAGGRGQAEIIGLLGSKKKVQNSACRHIGEKGRAEP